MNRRFAVMLLMVCAWGVAPVVAGPNRVSGPHVNATLLADRAAVAAGEPLRLAVQLEIEDGWHIYWASGGDPGAPSMPTTFEVGAPDGFKVSEPQFPPPKRHKTAVDADLYILGGKPVVLFDVTTPAKLTGGNATFTVKANWLVCRESCLPGDGTLELTLPVTKSTGDNKPANEKLFKSAARALPLAEGKATYVKTSGRLTQDRVRPGDKFDAQLVIDVKAGHHIQSNTPSQESFVATDVFVAPTTGLDFEKNVFPKGKERTDKTLGKLSEYAGQVAITIPAEATEDFKGDRAQIRGVLVYQACNDKGTCFPPEEVEFSIDVPVAKTGEPIKQFAAILPRESKDGPGEVPEPKTGGGDTTNPPSAGTRSGVASGDSQPLLERLTAWFKNFGLAGYLALAFIGGFILNFMPCVLPVISLKVLSFVKQAHESRWRVFALGLTFSIGILLSFILLAFFALSATERLGWGGLFQNPVVSIVLAAIVTAMALSLFGVFTLSAPRAVDELGAKVSNEGFGSALAMGFLATLLGTACTAPFLTAVIAIAVKQPIWTGYGIFVMAGLGMASPYLALTANPAWIKFVPRAGPWMKTFEQVMGFVLLGTVIWLLNPLPAQLGGRGMILALIFILSVSFAAWMYGRLNFGDPIGRRLRYWVAVVAVIGLGWYVPFVRLSTIERLQSDAEAAARGATVVNRAGEIAWRRYQRDEVLAKVRAGHTVLVDYTAEWCASCKTNEATSLNVDSTRKLIEELNVLTYRADYTNKNAEIREDLERFGKSGVPVYVIYAAGKPDTPTFLPELLTPGLVHDALRAAGPSKPGVQTNEKIARRG